MQKGAALLTRFRPGFASQCTAHLPKQAFPMIVSTLHPYVALHGVSRPRGEIFVPFRGRSLVSLVPVVVNFKTHLEGRFRRYTYV